MTPSEKCLNLVRESESLALTAYLDEDDGWTIGWGHLITPDEAFSGKLHGGIVYADGITREQADAILAADVQSAVAAVQDLVRVPLNQGQFDALVDFVFNVGRRQFVKSTLLQHLNATLYEDIPTQLRRWVNDDGKRMPGLVKRREKEIALWNSDELKKG